MFCQCMVIVTDSMQVTMETSRMREIVPGAPPIFRALQASATALGWPGDATAISCTRLMQWTIYGPFLLVKRQLYKTIVLADVWVSYTCTCTLAKERPPSTFGQISCTGSKFTWMSIHPGASFAWQPEWTYTPLDTIGTLTNTLLYCNTA